jgi:hypothetical protein
MLKNRGGRAAVLCGLALGLLAAGLLAPAREGSLVARAAQAWAQGMEGPPSAADRQLAVLAITRDWPASSKKAASLMIEKYGQPDGYAADSLTWYDNGPWQRTIVHREGYRDRSLKRPEAVLQQAVGYRVPLAKFKELERFDPRLVPNRTRNELSMRSESEPVNFLAMNLADEIIMGWNDVDGARRFYDQVSELAKSGKSSPYMESLRFQLGR